MSWFQQNVSSNGQLRSARSYFPSDDGTSDGNTMMTDLVMSDIQKAIEDFENKKEEERKKALQQLRQPDYSWLMDWKLKAKKHLSFKESSEIESLCQKLKPYEWKEVITTWRDRLSECKDRDEILAVFRDVTTDIVNARIEREIQMIKEAEEPPQVSASGRRKPKSAICRALCFEPSISVTHITRYFRKKIQRSVGRCVIKPLSYAQLQLKYSLTPEREIRYVRF